MAIFLPDEIWRQIFSHFEMALHNGDGNLKSVKNLAALSLVSRRFHHIAQSLLHRTIQLWRLHNLFFGAGHELYLRLAKAIANNPQLGLLTREISLAHGAPTAHVTLSIDDNLMDLLRNRIELLNISSEFIDLLKRDIIFGQQGSGVASFLLALMPRVRLVELWFYDEIPLALPYLLGGRLSQNTGEPHTVANHLHNLQELRIVAAHRQTCAYNDCFGSIFLHPNLRTLKLSRFDWSEETITDMEWPDYPCNLRQLNLNRCIVDASTIRNVLSCCTKLQNFIITADSYDTYSDPRYRDWKVDLNEFGDVLRELGQNLVKFEFGTPAYERVRLATGKVGSLQSLKALTHLSIARNDFIGAEDDFVRPKDDLSAIPLAEALPTSIEVMDFKEDTPHARMIQGVYWYGKMHDEIYSLAVGGQFPSLREIKLLRRGIPEDHRFEREVPGWDVEDTNRSVSSVLVYEDYTKMTLCMKRRDGGSERVQNV
ncbi:hypothetical protein LCI18_006728 [Fusarium solani-melongenae]|uniref:Uncharacterized protein n=1 Tax=Fusarium solani subsp. cucurbitae TaxID=2747967 RepID=A0ACD3Z6T5_FUSSC|nr:hypothetical protein LCI18_006728 [Fusarium solani-melongenae]